MNLGRVAILKPDHLGDLILASPAINVLSNRLSDVTLLVNETTLALAKFLFPQVRLESIQFNHLCKSNKANHRPQLTGFDTIIALRSDPIISIDWLKSQCSNVFQVQNTKGRHEAECQRDLVRTIVGDYNPLSFFGCPALKGEKKIPNSVGLSIACGHSSNSWPIVYWASLAQKLKRMGKVVYLIGGPQESTELQLLARLASLPSDQILLGSQDFSLFLKVIATIEVVIATDSGTAHICSLVTKIFSIFGPSEHSRYRPLGEANHVISLNLNCSPCLQFAKDKMNYCISRECLSSMTPNLIFKELPKNFQDPE